MGSRAGDSLPVHVRDGRGTFSGPLQGGYVTFVVTVDTLVSTESPEFELVAPFDMRIMKISTTAEAIGGATPDFQVQNAGTDLVAVVDVTVAAIDHTLVAAQRNVAKDALLNVLVNPGAVAADTITAFCCTITAYARGHVFADDASD